MTSTATDKPAFSLHVTDEQGAKVFHLHGRLMDQQQADHLMAVLDEHLKDNEGVNVILDMGGLVYMNGTGLNIMISVLTALVISAAIKIVGALLVSALLTVPAACSLALARSFRQSVAIVVLIGEVTVIAGLWIAGVWNLAPGGTVVLLLIAVLAVALTVRSRVARV